MENTKISASYARQYKKAGSQHTTFVYAVSGTPEELAKFEQAQGDYYRTDDKTGAPLWFTTRFVGDDAKLIITSNNKVVADMSEYEKADSLAKQFGGNLGAELTRAAAARLMNPKKDSSPEA